MRRNVLRNIRPRLSRKGRKSCTRKYRTSHLLAAVYSCCARVFSRITNYEGDGERAHEALHMQALLWRGGVLSLEPISWPCYMVLTSQAQNHPWEVSQVVPLLISGSSHTSAKDKRSLTPFTARTILPNARTKHLNREKLLLPAK